MHVPTVTDEMLDKVLQAAASPVFVEFTEADSSVSARIRRRVEVTAEEFDDRVIFLRLYVDENPGPAESWRIDARPTLVVFKRGREIGRIGGDVPADAVSDLIEKAITAEA
jgi:thioredoxin-like negative regulator of GroEL